MMPNKEYLEGNIIIDNTVEERQKVENKYVNYGIRDVKLSEDEIKALQEGKCIAFSDDEYLHFLSLKK